MKQTKQIIPVHSMDTESPLGIEFNYMEMTNDYDEIMLKTHKNEIHRDDYYMFLFLERADAVFTVDFEEIEWHGKTVFYIRPGQVHFVSSIREARGYSMAIDAILVEDIYINSFEGQFATQKPIDINSDTMTKLSEVAHLLNTYIEAASTPFSNDIISNLANVFIGIIAEQYAHQQESFQHNKSRSALIAYRFKELLSDNFKTMKSPAEYARMLNYSLSHLNESVKNTTGSPVSYWIQQQVILEAKRLLYYTDLDVKEIAFKLGYEDHTYFSRLFSKTVNMSPSAFRHKFHE
jgi:AraC-like DNA-binding protein